MKTLAFTILTSLLAVQAIAQEPPTTPAATPKRTILKYTAPKTAGTGLRADGDGGSRADGLKGVQLYVLAPDHIALTTQAQPSLFWFQSAPADVPVRFELTLIDPKNPKPMLKVGAPLAGQKDGGAGVHRIQLGRQKLTLDPGVAYKWSVALVPDANNRSKDLVASGVIQRIEAGPELSSQLEKAAPAEKVGVYASNAVWYDALASLSDQIDAAPKDASLRAARADLLDQVGLKAAAEYERKKKE